MPSSSRAMLAVSACAAVYAVLLVRTAWLGDDAYITFRVIDNALQGYGLRWNVVERVQAFTSPLWTLLLIPIVALTREVYYTSIAVSMLLSMIAFLYVGWRGAGPWQTLIALAALLSSKAYLDYSTSGLENALGYLLLASFCAAYLDPPTASRPARLGAVTGLLLLNRLDAAVLLAIPVGLELWRQRAEPRAFKSMLAFSLAPSALWTLFSLLYYGFPFPNTAYAKLHTGIAQRDLWQQGLYYFLSCADQDPVTLVVIGCGCLLTWLVGSGNGRALGAGVALHLVYVASVGGDFMCGRFLTPALLVSAILISRAPLAVDPQPGILATVAVVLLGLVAPHPNLTSGRSYGDWHGNTDPRGVTDERAYYYWGTGLLGASRKQPMPTFNWAHVGARLRAQAPIVLSRKTVGMVGYFGGPQVHVIDANALGDALLARLPVMRDWRIGHFTRRLPSGYEQIVVGDDVRGLERGVVRYYKKLRIVIRGPLFSLERLNAIWEVNTTAERDLAGYAAFWGSGQRVRADALGERRPEGQLPDDRTVAFSDHGLEIDLDGVRHARYVDLGLDANDSYWVAFRKDGYVSWRVLLPRLPHQSGVGRRVLRVDSETVAMGYDVIEVVPEQGDDGYFIAHLRLLDTTPEEPLAEPATPPAEAVAPEPQPSSPPDDETTR